MRIATGQLQATYRELRCSRNAAVPSDEPVALSQDFHARFRSTETVNIFSKPVVQFVEFALPDRVIKPIDIALGRPVELRRHNGAYGIRGKVPEEAGKEMNILKNAVGIVPRR